jgi:hypothetical protein
MNQPVQATDLFREAVAEIESSIEYFKLESGCYEGYGTPEEVNEVLWKLTTFLSAVTNVTDILAEALMIPGPQAMQIIDKLREEHGEEIVKEARARYYRIHEEIQQ